MSCPEFIHIREVLNLQMMTSDCRLQAKCSIVPVVLGKHMAYVCFMRRHISVQTGLLTAHLVRSTVPDAPSPVSNMRYNLGCLLSPEINLPTFFLQPCIILSCHLIHVMIMDDLSASFLRAASLRDYLGLPKKS